MGGNHTGQTENLEVLEIENIAEQTHNPLYHQKLINFVPKFHDSINRIDKKSRIIVPSKNLLPVGFFWRQFEQVL